MSEPPDAVKLSLHSTAAAVAPGATFWLAARFEIAPGYRIFWLNPGDVGNKTEVHFDVPIGFEATESRYPPPTKFVLDDGRVSFGYETRTAAFAKLRATPDLREGDSYRVDVEAKWVACKEECFQSRARAFVEFDVDPSASEQSFDPELAELRSRLPTPLPQVLGARYEWKKGTLSVRANAGPWTDFFPQNPSQPKLSKFSVKPKTNELLLTFEQGERGSRVRGLAVADGDDGPTFVQVDLPYEGPVEVD